MSDEPRDPVAEQDEAAARFEEATGRNPMDPAPPAFMGQNASGEVVVYGPSGNTDRIDHFARRGIPVERRTADELPAGVTGVFGRYPGGTDPGAAVREVVAEFFRLAEGGLETGILVKNPVRPDFVDGAVPVVAGDELHHPDGSVTIADRTGFWVPSVLGTVEYLDSETTRISG